MRKCKRILERAIQIACTTGCFSVLLATQAWADPLQGRVEQDQPGATKLKSGAEQGSLQDSLEAKLDQLEFSGGTQGMGLSGGTKGMGLSGGAQSGPLNPLQAGADASAPMKLGVENDPDSELQIDWDRWRNTLTQAIQAGTINKINVHNDINFVLDPARQMMVSRYPQGISAQYSCDVLPDRRIINLRLMQSSGYPSYDQAVMQSIIDLMGNSILRYPKGSKRQIVNQQASVFTSANNQFQNFKFGDLERQRQ